MEASREGHEDVVRLLIESGEKGEGRREGKGREERGAYVRGQTGENKAEVDSSIQVHQSGSKTRGSC